jgi:hypothetical protein
VSPPFDTVDDDHPIVQNALDTVQQATQGSDSTVQRALGTARALRGPPRVPRQIDPPIRQVIKRGVPIQSPAPPSPEAVAAAKADTRGGADIVNERLNTIVPEHTRVAGGTYTPGAPGGGRWADHVVDEGHELTDAAFDDMLNLRRDFDPARDLVSKRTKLTDMPGKGFRTNDKELKALWDSAVNESSAAAKNAVEKHNVRPTFSADDWHQAMQLPMRDHLWYELSGEKMAENLPDLTAKEHMKMLDILGATSARAKPDENLERTLASLSQHLRKQPIDVDLTIPSTVRQALSREHEGGTSALPGNKTGHFSDTLALAGGVPSRFPISVNDVWVGKMFGVPDDVMSSNQSLHEPMAIYFNKLRDLYNERHGHELPFKYQSWNFQAPAWVHLRSKDSGAEQGDAYHQVWGKTLDKLRAAGVQGIKGDQITRQALMDPKFADALRRTTKPYRDAPKATVEFGTTQTPIGARAHELYKQAIDRGDPLSQHEYLKGLTTAMYQSARGKDHPWDRLKKAVTGKSGVGSDITRIAAPTSDAPLDIGGTFEGAVSPNIRIPLRDMDDDHLRYFNAIAGKHLKQDAMAISQIHGAEHGSEPRPGTVRGHTLFIPTTEQIPVDQIRGFAKELSSHGHDMSYQRHPNGYQFDILPAFGDDGPKGIDKNLLDDVYGKTLHPHYGPAMVSAHDFRSVYTPSGEYADARKELLKRFKDDYVKQATTAGVSRRDAEAALKAEAPPGNFPSGGKAAWSAYKSRNDHLAGAEKGFQELAQRVAASHKTFIDKAEKRFKRPPPPAVDPNAPPFKRGGAIYDRVPKVVEVAGRYASGGAVELQEKSKSPNHNPTDAQKSAGNYAKGKLSFQGLPISIENAAGSTRSGVDARGKKWSSRVPCDYGYIRGTEGADGDHVDCYIGPDADSNLVVVVNQQDADGHFDEHKCLLGFKSEKDALRCYCDGFSDGKGADRIGSVESMSVDAFKRWLKRGKTVKPVRARSIVDQALKLVSARST